MTITNYDECLIGGKQTNCQGVIMPDFYPINKAQRESLTRDQKYIILAKQRIYTQHIESIEAYNTMMVFFALMLGIGFGVALTFLFSMSSLKLTRLCKRVEHRKKPLEFETVQATDAQATDAQATDSLDRHIELVTNQPTNPNSEVDR